MVLSRPPTFRRELPEGDVGDAGHRIWLILESHLGRSKYVGNTVSAAWNFLQPAVDGPAKSCTWDG